MTRDTDQLADIRPYLESLAEESHLLGPVDNGTSQCAYSLISHEQYSGLRSPEIMLKVMSDTAGLTHAGCRQDHLGCHVEVDGLGLIARDT